MSTEVVKIACHHCRATYLTPRFNIVTTCAACNARCIINTDYGYHIRAAPHHTQRKSRATVYTVWQAEWHIAALKVFGVKGRYSVELLEGDNDN